MLEIDFFWQKSMAKWFFAKLIFFPRKFFLLRKISLFQNTKKKFWREKINLAKKVGPKTINY
jgi:hypothetical protein